MWLSRFEKTRLRLYWLTIVILVVTLSIVVLAAVLGQAVEPISNIPPKLVGFFTPGLPANLIDIAMKFPYAVFIAVIALIVTLMTSRRIQLDENEYAFQRWRTVFGPLAEGNPRPVPKPPLLVKVISHVAWTVSTILLITAIALVSTVLVVGICFLCSTCSIPDVLRSDSNQSIAQSYDRTTSGCRPSVVCARQLRSGEKVEVIIAASRKRNETGFLLEEGEIYTAKYISHRNWKDGDFEAHLSGVEFEGWNRFAAWGMEWLRPYPEGAWFQIIGRIDRSREVFAVLREGSGSKWGEFEAPEDGELVLLVNDVHYENNSGWMTIEIGRPQN